MQVRVALAALALTAAAPVARADSFVALFEPDYASDAKQAQTNPYPSRPIKHLCYPVLGMPSLVEPKGTIPMKVLLANGGGTADWKATLVTRNNPVVESYALKVTGKQDYDRVNGVYTVELEVDASIPAALYDLVLESGALTLTNGQPDRQPNAVRVLDPNRKNRHFAVICDSQIQDVGFQSTKGRLREFFSEIRLRNPDFVLYCGDLNFGNDYAIEYEENLALFTECGLPCFFVPGNHDGYATLIPDANGGLPHLERDGLNHWRRYIGPTAYSFDWEGHHFTAVNSMGGTAERRNSAGIVVTNFGGEVSPDEMSWVEKDVAAASARGKKSVLFMHHDPSVPVVPNKPSYPYPLPTFGWADWNDQVSHDRIEQLIAKENVTHVFYGHIHRDRYLDRTIAGGKTIPHIGTTTLGCGNPGLFGYRWVTTQAGAIAEWHYMGTTQQSVPFPQVGLNLETTYSGARDGSAAALSATVSSRLIGAAEVEVVLPVANATALRATGSGQIVSVSASNGILVARVRATVPASGTATFGVEPDAGTTTTTSSGGTTVSSGGVSTTGTSTVAGSTVPGSTQNTSNAFGSGGGAGGGCALGGSDQPRAALPLALVLVALVAARRRARGAAAQAKEGAR